MRYATRLWGDALFTGALATVAVAALGAVYRKQVPVPGFDPYATPVYGSSYVPPTAYPQYSTAVVVSELPDWDNLDRAGHSLTALLAAFVFGAIARRFYRTA